jgi:carboxyl-terminal processing protease
MKESTQMPSNQQIVKRTTFLSNPSKSITFMLAFLACTHFSLVNAAEPASKAKSSQAETKKMSEDATLPLDDLRKFAEVFERIKKTYVEDVDDSTLINNAIKGMISGLDPHSAYLEPSAYSELQESTSGEFGGLGIEVGMENGFVKVITPIDDTPAQKAGVEAGDLIIKINDHPVQDMVLGDAINMMRGKPGTKIKLTIAREGVGKPIDIEVTRAIIQVTSVKSSPLTPGYGYIRITQFQSKTGDDFVKAIHKLEKENGGPLKGLVLDLRNNPGGVLQAAVSVADSMLNKGLIVFTKGKVKSSQFRFSATPGDDTHGTPIVVLINGGSASASEILAGALQDHHRAIIMGTNSFGKGSVQTVIPLDSKYGLKLTTARYYTPSGRSIQALGIVPDIKVKQAKLTEVASSGEFYKESDLTGHLNNDTLKKQNNLPAPKSSKHKKNDKTKPSKAEKIQQAISRDYQLREALNLLKGINVIAKNKSNSIQTKSQ